MRKGRTLRVVFGIKLSYDLRLNQLFVNVFDRLSIKSIPNRSIFRVSFRIIVYFCVSNTVAWTEQTHRWIQLKWTRKSWWIKCSFNCSLKSNGSFGLDHLIILLHLSNGRLYSFFLQHECWRAIIFRTCFFGFLRPFCWVAYRNSKLPWLCLKFF